jgi:hypothetical protein
MTNADDRMHDNLSLDLNHLFLIGVSGAGHYKRLDCTLYVRESDGYKVYAGLTFDSHRDKTFAQFEREIQELMHEFYTDSGWLDK